MNIDRIRLPWQRRYNWRIWYCKHKRSIRLFILMLFVAAWIAVIDWVMQLYIGKLEAEHQKVSAVGACWAKEMAGAPKVPEDQLELAEINWKKMGWRE